METTEEGVQSMLILDVRTTMLVGSGFTAVTGTVLYLISRQLSGSLRDSARLWALASGTIAGSWLLHSFGDLLGDFVTIFFGNLLLLLACLMLFASVQRFDGRRSMASAAWLALTVPPMALILIGRYLFDGYTFRVVVMSLALAVPLLLGGVHLLRHSRFREVDLARKVTAGWFLVGGAVLVLRVADALIGGGAAVLLQNSIRQTLAMALNFMSVIGLIFSYFLLLTSRTTAELKLQAQRDPLTGLLNRRGFSEWAVAEMDACSKAGNPLALLLLDADDFKEINDNLGHATGDATLQAISDVLRANLRSNDLIARFGGDEFVVALPNLDSAEARELVARLDRAFALLPNSPRVSVGVAMADSEVCTLDSLIERADRDLYEQKRRRRHDRRSAVGRSEATWVA